MPLNCKISPADGGMSSPDNNEIRKYFSDGRSAISVIRYALGVCGNLRPRSILDFAAGYGRVLRHLLVEFPNSTITACDINEAALEFCRDTFGVATLASRSDLALFWPPHAYDLIWCGSLFSHLPESAFRDALQCICRSLTPDGVAVITTHGRFSSEFGRGRYLPGHAFDQLIEQYDANGFGYVDYPHSNEFLGKYGVTLTSPSWVMNAVEAQTDVRIKGFIERGWCEHQDVLILQKKSIWDEQPRNRVSKNANRKSKTEEMLERVEFRTRRPFYPMADGWGLTHLDSGEPFYVNTRDHHITPWLIMAGHWEPRTARAAERILKAGMTAIDVGANVGFYTIRWGALVGRTGRVIAFEPNPDSYAYCRENILLNGLHNSVEVRPVALSDHAGFATLYSDPGAQAQASLFNKTGTISADVPVSTLDEQCSDIVANLIKIDVEGLEPNVLKGAQGILKRSPACAVLLETNIVRWEAVGPFSDLAVLIGSDRKPHKITGDGSIVEISWNDLYEHLQQSQFTEDNIVFIPASAKDDLPL